MQTGLNRLIQKSTPKQVLLINGMVGEFIKILGNFYFLKEFFHKVVKENKRYPVVRVGTRNICACTLRYSTATLIGMLNSRCCRPTCIIIDGTSDVMY
jgi:hypothetical protein